MGLTQLTIRYSPVYDKKLAELCHEHTFSDEHAGTGFSFAEEFQTFWKEKNDRVFRFYAGMKLTLPEFWLAYPVHPWKTLRPYNDPMTFFISDDKNGTIATIIHELAHAFISYQKNKQHILELWQPIARAFPNAHTDVQEHILVNILASGGYFHIFSDEIATSLIKREFAYESLSESWRLISEYLKGNLSLLKSPLSIITSLNRKVGSGLVF